MRTPSIAAASIAVLSLLLAGAPARADLPGESFKNHMMFSLGVGVGSLSPSEFNAYVDSFNSANGGTAGPGRVSYELHVPILATYYAPYYIMGRVGVEAAYFFPSYAIGGDSITNYGGIVEVPIELGGHYSFLDDRLIVEAALGPAIVGYTSAGLSGNNGPTGVQLYANPSVGLDDELKGQFFLSPGFSVGLEIGYRVLTSGPLHQGGQPTPYEPTGTPIHLDMSGFRGVFELGFRAF